MKIIDELDLGIIGRTAERKHGQEWLTEAVDSKKRSAKYNEVTVFLSHKHSDKSHVENMIALLNDLGVEVYVDWKDYDMPKTTSGFTAKQIKKRIKNCDKFILLATEDAIASKWCNWELGFGDADKYLVNKVAIFPIKKYGKDFTGSEYLKIYPHILEGTSYSNEKYKWKVKYPDNDDHEYLIEWLKR